MSVEAFKPILTVSELLIQVNGWQREDFERGVYEPRRQWRSDPTLAVFPVASPERYRSLKSIKTGYHDDGLQ